MKPIYLDYNATTPILTEVAEAMQPCLSELFGNPSSSHWYGIQSRNAIDNARKQVAALLSCDPNEIVFTSGGSESNNMAIKGVAHNYKNKGNHIITTSIEHPAVIEVCKFLESQNFRISYLPVDEYGVVDLVELDNAITDQTILITIMHANNEIGTIEPIAELSAICKEKGIIFHTDAVASIGNTEVDVNELNVDLLSLSGPSLGAPKGTGALYFSKKVRLMPLIHGGIQENGRRAGTENVPGIVGLGRAAELAQKGIQTITKILTRNVAKGKMTDEEMKAVLGRIRPSVDLKDMAKADFIVEAATEKESLKFQLFKELDEICAEDVILATNTSSIPIGRISAQTQRPEKVIGMHFMNPVPVMKLVEVIRGHATNDETVAATVGLAEKLGKVPVEANDYPGFVANRILMPMINEAVYTLMEGVATREAIDEIMKLGMAHPMGPLALADLIGLDVCLSILEVLHTGLGDSKYRPCPLLKRMVAAGDD